MFDKLFELIAKSTRFGFALAFAGTLFIAGNIYGWWSIKLSPENTSYIIFATLLGYGILIAAALGNGFKIAYALLEVLFAWIGKRRRDRNVMDRLHELTPRQTAVLWWISRNPKALIGRLFLRASYRAKLRPKPWRSLPAQPRRTYPPSKGVDFVGKSGNAKILPTASPTQFSWCSRARLGAAIIK